MNCQERCSLALVILLGLSCALAAQVQDPPARDENPELVDRSPLFFRRVLVPRKDLPKLMQDFVPIRRDDVETMIQLINRAGQAPPVADQVRISSARYRARLRGDQLVAGEAELKVNRLDDRPEDPPEEPLNGSLDEQEADQEMASPVRLPLRPLGLAIGTPRWRYGEDEEPLAATVGRDANGIQVCIVPRSGTLEFSWSLAGKKDSLGELQFDLQFPSSPSNQLVLELPANVTPQIDRGIVSHAALPVEDLTLADATSTTADPSGTLLWILELGGHAHVRLTITPENPFRQRRQLTFLRQTTSYVFSNTGLDVTIQLNLDVYNEPLRQLAVQLGELELIDARIGDEPIEWTEPGQPGPNSHELVLPEGILGQNHMVVLHAIGKLRPSSWSSLPAVSVQNVFWREGEIQLQIPAQITLTRLRVSGGQVTRVEPGELGGENRVIQLHQPAADVEIVVERRVEEIHEQTVLEIAILPPRVTARFTANLSSSYGSRFEIAGVIAPGWIVDSVETEPASSIDSYDVSIPNRDGSGSRLLVLLKSSIRVDRPTQLVVRAHRVSGVAGLTGENLQPLVLEQVVHDRQVVSVRVDPPFQLQLRRDAGLLRLDRDDLSPEEAAAIDVPASALLYEHSAAAEKLALVVRRIQPRYLAEIAVQVEVVGNTLRETYQVGCTPRSSSLNRLVLHFYESRDELFQWRLLENPEVNLLPRKLDEAEQEVLGISGGETWELVLAESFGTRFDLEVTRESALQETSNISLLMLPEATSQVASLAILSRDEEDLNIEAGRLKRILPRVIPVDRYMPIRMMYRYQPSADSKVTISQKNSSQQNSLGWIWRALMRSRFTTDGVVHHHVSYFVENSGRRHIGFTLPAAASDLHVLVDGEQVPVSNLQRIGLSASIPLPQNQRYCTIQLHYREQSTPLGALSTRLSGAPQPDCPVMESQWEVLLPAGYQPLRSGNDLSGEEQYLSWGKRLFGPLWRADDDQPAFAATRRNADGLTHAGIAVIQVQEAILELDSLLRASSHADRPASWGELFKRSGLVPIDSSFVGGRPSWWFDHRALQLSGVTPATLLPPRALSMADLVREFHLQLLVTNSAVVLTSTDSPLLVRLPVQWSSDLIGLAPSLVVPTTGMASNHGLMSSRVWLANGTIAPIPWQRYVDRSFPGRADRHWNISWHSIESDAPVRLVVYHQVTMQSFAWALFLSLLGLFSWFGLHRPIWLTRLAIASFALALLAPSIVYPFPTCIWLAALISRSLILIRHRSLVAAEDRPDGETEFTFRLQMAPRNLLILFLFFGLFGFTVSSGQDTQPPQGKLHEEAAPVVVHRMLIPVDDKNQPAGQYNFVPPPFFDELHRRSARLTQPEHNWLIRSAQYVSSWEWSQDMQQLLDGTVLATYQLAVLKDKEKIRLPIRVDQVHVGDILLDGQPVQQLEISPQDHQVSFRVEKAGNHELSLRLTPRRQRQDGFSFIQFSVPSVSNTQLRLQLPVDAPRPSLPDCIGMTSHDDVSGQLVAELGPVTELTIRWPENPRTQMVQSEVDVQSSFWLRVRPNAVTLDAQFRFVVLSGSVTRIQLETDPRLRLVSVRGGQFISGQPRVRNDEQQTILLSLDTPQQQDFMLETTFYLNESSGIGNLQLPRLDVIAQRHGERQVAMTVSDQLDWQVDSGETVEEIDAVEFGETWGTGEIPQRAFRLATRDSDWSLSTQDRRARISVVELLDLQVAGRRLALLFTADLEISDGSLFQLRLQSPVGFKIQGVLLDQDGIQVPVRAEQFEDDGIVVFLDRAISGQQRLTVRGELALDGPLVPIPVIRLLDAETTGSRIRVFRHHGVDVVVDNVSSMYQFLDGADQLIEDLPGRLVGELQLDSRPVADRATPAELLVKEYPDELRAVMVTRVSQQGNQWIARVDCELSVDDAVVDQLRFEIPATWAESFEVTPEMNVEVLQIPMQSRHHVVLTPRQPLEGRARISFSARLPAGSGTFRVPDVLFLDSLRTLRYLVLPGRLEERQVQWATSGLQRAAKLPAVMSDLSVEDSALIFQGILPDFEARISDVQQTEGRRQVSLADVRIRFHQPGRFFGVVTLDLEPAGSDRVAVLVPAGFKLVHARVAGVAASLDRLAANRLDLSLFSSQLPQRVELLFMGKSDVTVSRHKTWQCDYPRLENIPVARTAWTIVSDGQSAQAQEVTGIEPISRTSIEERRIDQLFEMTSLVSELATVSQPVSSDDWYVPWQRQYHQVKRRLAREELNQGLDPANSQLPQIEQRQQAIQQRLGVNGVESLVDGELVNPPSAGDMFDALLASSPKQARFESTDGETALLVRFPGLPGSSFWSTLGRWILVLGSIAVVLGVARKRLLNEFLGRWPFAWSAIGGLAWWLYLTPSFVGVLIMVLSASAAVRAARGSWLESEAATGRLRSMSTVTYVKR
jgi:hypothetical protein